MKENPLSKQTILPSRLSDLGEYSLSIPDLPPDIFYLSNFCYSTEILHLSLIWRLSVDQVSSLLKDCGLWLAYGRGKKELMGEGDTKRIAAVKPRVSMAQPERVAIRGGTLGIGNTSLEESSGGTSSILIPSICLPFAAAAQGELMKIWCHCTPLF